MGVHIYLLLNNVPLLVNYYFYIDAELKLQSVKRKLELSNTCVEIETKRMILEEIRQLNDYEAGRAFSCVWTGNLSQY